MSFIRRGHPKPAKKVEHKCPLPRWRWLPFLFWPRWREGAQWECMGCWQTWEWNGAVLAT